MQPRVRCRSICVLRLVIKRPPKTPMKTSFLTFPKTFGAVALAAAAVLMMPQAGEAKPKHSSKPSKHHHDNHGHDRDRDRHSSYYSYPDPTMSSPWSRVTPDAVTTTDLVVRRTTTNLPASDTTPRVTLSPANTWAATTGATIRAPQSKASLPAAATTMAPSMDRSDRCPVAPSHDTRRIGAFL